MTDAAGEDGLIARFADGPQAPAGFEQAKNPAQEPQFLQIVAKPESPSSRRDQSRS
jgi:hypothetical protein